MVKRILILLVLSIMFVNCNETGQTDNIKQQKDKLFEGIPKNRGFYIVDFDKHRSNISIVNGRIYWKNTLQRFKIKKTLTIKNKKYIDTVQIWNGLYMYYPLTYNFDNFKSSDSLFMVKSDTIMFDHNFIEFSDYIIGNTNPYEIDSEEGIIPRGRSTYKTKFQSERYWDPLTKLGFFIDDIRKKIIKIRLFGNTKRGVRQVGEIIIDSSSNEISIFEIDDPKFEDFWEEDEYFETRESKLKELLKLKIKSKLSKYIDNITGKYRFGLDGSFSTYFDNGQVKMSGNLINGDLYGEFKRYYKTGEIKEKGKFLNGILIGKFQRFSTTGKLLYELNYDKVKKYSPLKNVKDEYKYVNREYMEHDIYETTNSDVYFPLLGEELIVYDNVIQIPNECIDQPRQFLEDMGYKVISLESCVQYYGIVYKGIVEETYNGETRTLIRYVKSIRLKSGECVIIDTKIGDIEGIDNDWCGSLNTKRHPDYPYGYGNTPRLKDLYKEIVDQD